MLTILVVIHCLLFLGQKPLLCDHTAQIVATSGLTSLQMPPPPPQTQMLQLEPLLKQKQQKTFLTQS